MLAALGSFSSWRSYADAVLSAAAQEVGAGAGSVMLTDADPGVLRVVAARGPGHSRILGTTVAVGQPIAGVVAAAREPLCVPDVESDPQWTRARCSRTRTRRYAGRSMLAVPWTAGDRLLGVLNLSSRDGRRFSDADLDRVVGGATGVARALDVLLQAAGRQTPAPPLWDECAFQTLGTMAPVAVGSVKAVLDLVNQAVVCFDRRARITWLNATARALFDGARWAGGSLRALPINLPTADWMGFVEAGLANGTFPPLTGISLPGPEGSRPTMLQCTGSLFRLADGSVGGGCLVFTDTTDAVRLTEQLDAAEKHSALGRMMAEVAHELSSPLDSVRRLVQLARRKLAESPADEHLTDALSATNRMTNILHNLLAFSRRDVNCLAQPLPLTQVLDRYFAELAATERYPELHIIRDYRGLGPLIPFTDFTSIIDNLVRNACHAMEGRGTLVVYGQVDRETYVLEIQDTGCGMPPALRDRIFEPFFTTKAYGEGTGLGLALCRKMVESHGGTLTCTSERGVGSTFRIELPTNTPGAAERG